MELTGRIKKIYPQVEVGNNGYVKREFVIEHATNPEYPQFSKFELGKNQVGVVDDVSEGETVTVHYDLNGRAWTNKEGAETFFNTLKAWRVEKLTASPIPAQQPAQQPVMAGIGAETSAADMTPF